MAATTPNWFIGWPVTASGPAGHPLAALPPAMSARLSPVAPADWHITLAFLGACGRQNALAAWQCAMDRNAAGPPLTVHASGWALLGRNALALRVDTPTAALAQRIGAHREAIRAAAGLAAEDRPPLPHVTVARLTHRRHHHVLAAWAQAAAAPAGSDAISDLALYTRNDDPRSDNPPSDNTRSMPAGGEPPMPRFAQVAHASAVGPAGQPQA